MSTKAVQKLSCTKTVWKLYVPTNAGADVALEIGSGDWWLIRKSSSNLCVMVNWMSNLAWWLRLMSGDFFRARKAISHATRGALGVGGNTFPTHGKILFLCQYFQHFDSGFRVVFCFVLGQRLPRSNGVRNYFSECQRFPRLIAGF